MKKPATAARMLLTVLVIQGLVSTPALAGDEVEQDRRWFVGLNPLALFTEVDNLSLKMFAPFATGLEYGVAVAGGYFVTDSHMVEGRLSMGFPHQPGFSFLGQLQAGYHFFPLEHFDRTENGLYVGGALRYAGLGYNSTDESFHSILPIVNLGYWFELRAGVYFDLRISQVFGALSWSSVDHTAAAFRFFASPAKNISPVLPLFTFTVGYRM